MQPHGRAAYVLHHCHASPLWLPPPTPDGAWLTLLPPPPPQDLMERGSLKLSAVRYRVLDEVDRMMQVGEGQGGLGVRSTCWTRWTA